MRPGSPLRWHIDVPPPARPEREGRPPRRLTRYTTFGAERVELTEEQEHSDGHEDSTERGRAGR